MYFCEFEASLSYEVRGLVFFLFVCLFKKPSQGYGSRVGFKFPAKFRIQDLKCKDLFLGDW